MTDPKELIAEARRLAALWAGDPQMVVGHDKLVSLCAALTAALERAEKAEGLFRAIDDRLADALHDIDHAIDRAINAEQEAKNQRERADALCDALALTDDRLIAAERRLAGMREALESQVKAHAMLCEAAGLGEQAHLDGTAQARAALSDTKTTPAGEAKPVPEPVYKAVERILDEHSAWIARPNDEVTKRVALAATIAAHHIISQEMADD